jgi:energy-converting hydrogenase B subunit D
MPDALVDVSLALLIVGLAWRSLTSPDLFGACVTFVAFGLALSLGWARLGAPDVALAEAALGAGITGALLVDAARELVDRPPRQGAGDEPGE